MILGGGSPKNFYLQGQPTLWEVYGIPKGGNDYFIQITTDQVVWGGLSGATPAEAVSWGKVNPGVLPDTVVAYADSTIAFPLFCEYAVGSDATAAGRARSWCTSATRSWRRCARKPSRSTREETIADELRGRAERHRRWGRSLLNWARTPAGIAGQPRVYVDANMPARLVSLMRTLLKWDVLFVMEHDELRRALRRPALPARRGSCGARW